MASTDARLLPPNVSAYFGIESIEGYDPIILRDYEQFIAASERGKPDVTPPYGFNRIITPHNIDSPLFALLGARFILSLEELEQPYLRKVFLEGETRIYEDSRAAPRAHLVEEVHFERGREKILEKLFDSSFEQAKAAVVEKPLSILSVPLTSAEYVLVKEYSEGEFTFEVQALNSRFLVISNIFYPGWYAQIDGNAVEIYRTNYVFQGIVVPSGKHSVVLRYRG